MDPKEIKKLSEKEDDDNDPKKLNTWRDTYDSIDDYEKHHGHGFWGNSSTGYIYDKDENN